MKPTSKELAMRDPALAALVGALPGDHFGSEPSFGVEFGDDYGVEFGDEWGDEYGADSPPIPATAAHSIHVQRKGVRPSPQAMQAAWAAHQNAQAVTRNREMVINPNLGSQIKINKYTFCVNQSLVLGTAVDVSAENSPETNLRPKRIIFNAPVPGFMTVTTLKAANVSALVGGIEDAFSFNANGQGVEMDLPTLTPSNKVSVQGRYTGLVPTGYVPGADFLFVASFRGPATIIA